MNNTADDHSYLDNKDQNSKSELDELFNYIGDTLSENQIKDVENYCSQQLNLKKTNPIFLKDSRRDIFCAGNIDQNPKLELEEFCYLLERNLTESQIRDLENYRSQQQINLEKTNQILSENENMETMIDEKESRMAAKTEISGIENSKIAKTGIRKNENAINVVGNRKNSSKKIFNGKHAKKTKFFEKIAKLNEETFKVTKHNVQKDLNLKIEEKVISDNQIEKNEYFKYLINYFGKVSKNFFDFIFDNCHKNVYSQVNTTNEFKTFYNSITKKDYFDEFKIKNKHLSSKKFNFFNDTNFQDEYKKIFDKLIDLIIKFIADEDASFPFYFHGCQFISEKSLRDMKNPIYFSCKLRNENDLKEFNYHFDFYEKELNTQTKDRTFIKGDIQIIKKLALKNVKVETEYEFFKSEISNILTSTKITLSIKELEFLKNQIISLIETNKNILKRCYPDVIEGKFFLSNKIISKCVKTTNIDLYTYLYVFYLLKKNITSDNIIYTDFVDKNVDYTKINNLVFFKFDYILIVRYFFLRILFPFIDYEAFLNNVEIYFLHYYERIITPEKTGYKSIRRKLVLVALFYLKIQSDLRLPMQKKLPDKLFLIFCLIDPFKDKDNSIERLLNFFDAFYIFEIINCFIYKYLAECNVEKIKWLTHLNLIIQLFNNNNSFNTSQLRKVQLMGTHMLLNHLAVSYYF
ncbi:hypothetical protein GVAV_000432 [Gurleya vavrai]